MPQTLWTPDRDIPIDKQRHVESMLPHEMAVIRSLHHIAQRHGIGLICSKCMTPFQGLNDGHARVEAIFCQCREIRAESGRLLV